MFNFYTVNSGKLVDYLGGRGMASGKMKETGNSHWGLGNEVATNGASVLDNPNLPNPRNLR
jgi:hypothetical protein